MVRSTLARLAVTAALGASVISGFPTYAFADTSAELQTQLDQANAHLDSLYSQASEVGQQLLETQQDLDATNAEIDQKQDELDQAQDALASRVNANYKTGGVSIASIVFNASSFDDLVNRIYYASKVSASDAQVIQNVKDIQSELDSKKAEQQQLLVDQQTQKNEIDTKTTEAEQYVSSLYQQVQDKLAEEQAAREAAQKAAQEEAAKKAASNGGTYVDESSVAASGSNASASTAGSSSVGTATNGSSANSGSNASTSGNASSNGNSGSNASANSGSSSSASKPSSNGSSTSKPSNGGTVSDDSASVSGGLTTAQRNAIVAAAWSKVGSAYVLGANGPSAYDCSSFVQYCYAAAGISLPRTSYAQGVWGKATSDPQVGDIVCWGGHVGIYLGGGKMIDAGNERTGVIYRAVYGSPWYRTAA